MIKILKNLKPRDLCYILICAALVVVQVWLELTMPDYTQKLTLAVTAEKTDMDIVWENGGMMLLCAFGSMTAAIICGFFSIHFMHSSSPMFFHPAPYSSASL